jgi:addiction module toxin, RelE/StbE family
MRIKWLRLALQDINEIAEYIALDNPHAARQLVKQIWLKATLLSAHPEIGRPGRVSGTRELFIDGTRYIVPYRIVEDQIQILRVLHTSRNWPDNFEDTRP